MGGYVVQLRELDSRQGAIVGGKAANLGELSRIDGIDVPDGFCVTTEAFRRMLAQAPALDDRLDALSRLEPDAREAIGALSAEIRHAIESAGISEDVARAIRAALRRDTAYAVRSSATAEDSPRASFAGQHDSYLNVAGSAAILEHVSRCWASLFTERAITYRLRNGSDHRKVQMAVVVQQMVFARVAGILFTADPVTSNRKVISVEAGFGLGENLVSGLVNPDTYKVRDGEVIERALRHEQPVLSDAQIVALAQLARHIEAHFGRPQDIEWCLDDDRFQIVQSRPITTLFPIPDAGDDATHVYVSVGHQQMMTEAMKPLGLSFWQMTTPRPMAEAGGRLFVDVAPALASTATRAGILALGRSDPLMGDALAAIVAREGFIAPHPADAPAPTPAAGTDTTPLPADPAIVTEIVQRSQASLATLQREIATKSGAALLDFIRDDLQELKRILFNPYSLRIIMSAMRAVWWLNEQLQEWLGEKNAGDTLSQSVPHNVTSEMGLALLDVADAIRPHPDVVAFLRTVKDDSFLDELPRIAGGREARDAIHAYLDKYGMRCVGEIDITRPRWSERPSTLVPLILSNVENFEPGAAQQRFEQGRQQAAHKEQELLDRLRALPDGEHKADEAKEMIDRVRAFSGFREYPKYGMVSRYFIYKQALLREAERLAAAGLLDDPHDIFFLRFEELSGVLGANQVDDELLRQRKDAFESFATLTPPRVMTSEGEVIAGSYRREDVPAGALVGLPVCAGIVEGRARVIRDLAQADLQPGDILVTAYTDPSWTPLFVAVKALVTEVGGLMTHGAVIAREYGLPAVVGVERATQLIRDGQRIRVHGNDGYVELLS